MKRGAKGFGEGSTTVVFTAPKEVVNAINAVAQSNYESPAAFVRRIVVERLRSECVLPKIGEQQS